MVKAFSKGYSHVSLLKPPQGYLLAPQSRKKGIGMSFVMVIEVGTRNDQIKGVLGCTCS